LNPGSLLTNGKKMNNKLNTPICEKLISSPMTWVAETMLPNDGLVSLEAQHLD